MLRSRRTRKEVSFFLHDIHITSTDTRTSMIKMTTLAVLTAGLIFAGSFTAAAQTSDAPPVFIDVNVGAQTQSRAIESSTSFPLYGETAVINSAQSIDSGGLFDVSGGYRFMRSYGV